MNENIIENISIDLNIFENSEMTSITNNGKVDDLNEAYAIWEEANNTIESSNGNKEKLNQGFLSLKRAFNVTSIELKNNLAINNIMYSTKNKKRDFLSDLEFFEITKIITISKYLKIRNLIEHDNHLPPSIEDCMSLSEYIWTYIRSVTNILCYFTEHVMFTNKDDFKSMISFDYVLEGEYKNYYPHLYVLGIVESKYISFVERKNSIKINKIRLLNKSDEKNEPILYNYSHLIDGLNHIIFKGEILDQDRLANYVKYSILPEYGGLDEHSIKQIFS